MYSYLRICTIGLIGLLLFSCKKSRVGPPIPKIISIHETLNLPPSSSVPATTTYKFEYDQQGRIIAVNDRRFFYGSNGKVAYSRVRTERPGSQGMIYEYAERLRYEWDSNGRLASIVADSIYHHHYTVTRATVNTQFKSFNSGWVIARYNYDGSSKLPSSINYLTNFSVPGQSATNEMVHLEYEGDNAVRSHQFSTAGLPPYTPGGINYPVMTLHTWQRHTDRPHYLYPAFQQLGFHPYNFGTVVSAKGQNAIYSIVQITQIAPIEADWSKAEKFDIEYGDMGSTKQLRSPLRTITVTYN